MKRKNYGTYRFPAERSSFPAIVTGISVGFAIGTIIISVLFFL
jgi:hypothetical protein